MARSMRHAGSYQIGPLNGPGARRHLKREQRRKERRVAALDSEEAPRKRTYRGYGD